MSKKKNSLLTYRNVIAVFLIVITISSGLFIYSHITNAIPALPTNVVCEAGGCGSNPCNYMIFIVNAIDYAKNCVTGANDYSGTDIWALLNTIDSNLATNKIYHIAIRSGQYTGSATFIPGQNKGYRLTGDGGYGVLGCCVASNYATYLNFTGTTTSAIDTSTTWVNLNFGSQVLELADLTIQGMLTNSNLLNLPNMHEFRMDGVSILGNNIITNNIVINSRGINLPSNNQGDHFNIANSMIAGFYNGLFIQADHFMIMGTEINQMKNIYIEYGDAHYDETLVGVHMARGTATGSEIGIRDGRGIFQQWYVLTMISVIMEGLSTGYVNVNGAYYTAVGCSMPYFAPILGSNMPYGFVINQPQNTLTGTTAGTAVSSMPFREGTSYKKFVVYLNGYRNGGATAQTITFDAPFIHTPSIVKDDSGGSTVSTTTLTLPINMPSPVTGWIILEGY